ncbi:ribonuclease Oy [Halyomorpha halys]|uniref:ribonuclease Oy n=1 Tax=Halyomorpha halys TaxID=286706 RepID=UPI0006D521FF|nr:ribonuclease Oy-like [Halyomorpha halys]XP_014273787.1 ribonuclease Oy-like [Halyomorpha halys]
MSSTSTLTLAWILSISFFASMVNLGLCSNEWDLLIFTQSWPTSVCDSWKQGKGRSCRAYPKNIWTVHGIWPTKLGTVGPGNCDYRNPFNPSAVKGIENELDYYWTNVHNQGAKTSFWSHEWNKHGTCATSVPELSTQLKYFNQGLEWAKKYNMVNILGAAGIKPGQEFTVQNIRNGIKSVVNKNPQIICYVNSQRKSALLEVRLCFNKNLELVDCDGTAVGKNSGGQLTNCRSNWVLYPAAN